MKYGILSLLFFWTSSLFAQQPSISYLMCDEAKSQLQIHGSFGIDSGSVSIEDTTLGIASWSDSLIICNLPDSGKGAGGHVAVKTKKGVSNTRVLSIFYVTMDYSVLVTLYNGPLYVWFLNWRMDIGSRTTNNIYLPFEISKISFGQYEYSPPNLPWADSSFIKDSSI
ncbi:MAG: hypothetical protein ACHQM6_09445, partial [Candidatus Kapaibacterium sp.]